jgi:hypothetical protein
LNKVVKELAALFKVVKFTAKTTGRSPKERGFNKWRGDF